VPHERNNSHIVAQDQLNVGGGQSGSNWASPVFSDSEEGVLGRQLCGRVPHVVGVSVRRRDPNVATLDLFVGVDSDQVASDLPRTFEGYPVHVRRGGTPKFADR